MQEAIIAAEGVRLDWAEMPAEVRAAVEAVIGWPVAEAVTQRSGFSPGVAVRLRGRAGQRAFVKAVSTEQNPDTPGIHRREARIAALLPPSPRLPRLRGVHDDGTWIALVFDDVDGHVPAMPWRREELRAVLDAIAEVHELLTPFAGDDLPDVAAELAPLATGWEHIAADCGMESRLDGWCRRHLDRLIDLAQDCTAGVAGETLLHSDIRADNVLLTRENLAVLVDWPWAARGAAWVDVALMAPSVAAQGGPLPDELLAACRSSAQVPEDALAPFVAGIAGYFVSAGLRPAEPGLPTLRPFQAMQGRTACDWLRTLTGWS